MAPYTFTLKNIIPHDIEKKYGLSTLNYTTKIQDLITSPVTQNYTFIDETMKAHACAISMFDKLAKPLPMHTDISCFWCRHAFSNCPIGCPINYIPPILIKKYFSEVNKDTYTIKGPIPEAIASRIKTNPHSHPDSHFKMDKNNYYITDGIFCSFNCCLAFIIKNKKTPIYFNSEYFLKQIFYSFFDKNLEINEAPSWRLLTAYGGFMSIEKFRDSFNKVVYTDLHEYITHIPVSKPIGFLFEQKIKF